MKIIQLSGYDVAINDVTGTSESNYCLTEPSALIYNWIVTPFSTFCSACHIHYSTIPEMVQVTGGRRMVKGGSMQFQIKYISYNKLWNAFKNIG